METKHNEECCHAKPSQEKDVHKDLVCGMKVDQKSAKGESDFEGKHYYFCSLNCKRKFDESPTKYLTFKPEPERSLNKNIEYTCPMHPEVRQLGPGNCPICGMSLEPMAASLDNDDDSEYKSMSKRLWISGALSVPLLFLAMGGRHFLDIPSLHSIMPWIELLLSTPVVIWGGFPFFERFWQSLRNRALNMFTLIGLGVGVRYNRKMWMS